MSERSLDDIIDSTIRNGNIHTVHLSTDAVDQYIDLKTWFRSVPTYRNTTLAIREDKLWIPTSVKLHLGTERMWHKSKSSYACYVDTDRKENIDLARHVKSYDIKDPFDRIFDFADPMLVRPLLRRYLI